MKKYIAVIAVSCACFLLGGCGDKTAPTIEGVRLIHIYKSISANYVFIEKRLFQVGNALMRWHISAKSIFFLRAKLEFLREKISRIARSSRISGKSRNIWKYFKVA